MPLKYGIMRLIGNTTRERDILSELLNIVLEIRL